MESVFKEKKGTKARGSTEIYQNGCVYFFLPMKNQERESVVYKTLKPASV